VTIYALRAITTVLAFLYTLVVLGTCAAQTPTQTRIVADAVQEEIPLGLSAPVSVNILNPRGDISLALQEAADIFLAGRPGAQIRIQTVESPSEYRAVLRAKLSAGEQVDLFHIFGCSDLLDLREHVRDLSGLDWVGTALPEALEAVRVEGAVWGVPYCVEGIGLIANRRVLEAAGIAPGGLLTYSDISEAFAELRSQIDSGELAEEFPELAYVTEYPALDNRFLGEQLAAVALTGAFDTPRQAAEASLVGFVHGDMLEAYVQLMGRYSSSRRDWSGLSAVAENQQVENGLAAGRVAVIQQSTSIWKRVAQIDQALADQLVLLPISLKEDGEGAVYTTVPSYWAVNKNASDASAQLAEAFLTWLYQSDGGAFLAERFGVLSPYRESAGDTGAALHKQLLSYIAYGGTLPALGTEAPGDWGTDVFAPNLRAYLADELTWAEMLETDMLEWKRRRE